MPAPNPAALANTRSSLPKPLRTAVIIDYANMRVTGFETYVRHDPENTLPRSAVHLDPAALADLTMSLRNTVRNKHVSSADRPSAVTRIEVFLGRPNAEYQEVAATITAEQVRRWEEADARIRVHQRDLKYDRRDDGSLRVREKGVDTEAVLAAYRASLDPEIDLVVVLGHDCDIYPVVETIAAEGVCAVETGGWAIDTMTYPKHPSGERVWRTFLSATMFDRARDRTDYFHELGMDEVVARQRAEREEAAAEAARLAAAEEERLAAEYESGVETLDATTDLDAGA